MAAFFRKLASGVLLASSGIGTAIAQQVAAPDGVEITAEQFTYDGGSSRIDYEGLRVLQGDLTIEADRATSNAIDADDREWVLQGNVRVVIGDATIESDEARFTMRDAELEMFELRGDPATFEDPGAGPSEHARGSAEVLSYDAADRTLSLTGNAWLALGTDEVTGCDLIYDLDERKFMSGSTKCDELFRIRIIRPAEDSDAAEPTTAP